MLHRRPAITWANCDQVYQRIYKSSNLNVLIWWKCMVSYCRYHNGRTFIISCWRAWKVYANYICYILGRSLSCLIFCNYDSHQNWTWRMWSYILSVNIVFKHPTKLHHSRQTSYMETRSKLYGKLYAVYLKMWWKIHWQMEFSTYSHPSFATTFHILCTLCMQLLKGCKCNL